MKRGKSFLNRAAAISTAALALAIAPLVSRVDAQTYVPEVEWTVPLYTQPPEGEYPIAFDVDDDGIDDVLFANGSLLVMDRDTGELKQTIDAGEAVTDPVPFYDANGNARIVVNGTALHIVDPATGTMEQSIGDDVGTFLLREFEGNTLLIYSNVQPTSNGFPRIEGVDLTNNTSVFNTQLLNSVTGRDQEDDIG
jgi:hypothetical protein